MAQKQGRQDTLIRQLQAQVEAIAAGFPYRFHATGEPDSAQSVSTAHTVGDLMFDEAWDPQDVYEDYDGGAGAYGQYAPPPGRYFLWVACAVNYSPFPVNPPYVDLGFTTQTFTGNGPGDGGFLGSKRTVIANLAAGTVAVAQTVIELAEGLKIRPCIEFWQANGGIHPAHSYQSEWGGWQIAAAEDA